VREVEIYEDTDGNSELKSWLRELKYRKDKGIKDARIILNQIHYCIERVKSEGTYAPEEIAKHIIDDIWELRPDKYRVMFFQAREGRIILLNHFRKETQKTPTKQIKKAIQLRDDWNKRKM
jgi:phage-related protein